MMTTRSRFHTLAALPNSRLNTPMVPGPQTSWVIRTSACTHRLSPACTRALPAARARIVSVKVMVGDHYLKMQTAATVEIAKAAVGPGFWIAHGSIVGLKRDRRDRRDARSNVQSPSEVGA